MSAKPMNMIEKLANMGGALYRHQKAQFPRRFAILRGVWKHELAPPKQSDWPLVKADFARVVKTIETRAYRQYSVREGLVYAAVALEILACFFIGEMIGRRYIFGYLVPSEYVSKEARAKVRQQALEQAH